MNDKNIDKKYPENDAVHIPQPDWGDVFEAYMQGVKAGQEYPNSLEKVVRKAADAFCKLLHSKKDEQSFMAFKRGEDKSEIDKMVERFLTWEFPEDFNPDGSITFQPMRNPPQGTNLFDAQQAEVMIRHILGMSPDEGAKS